MKLFALSDLHLSLSAPYLPGSGVTPCQYKPMDRFGGLWAGFFPRLEANWLRAVGEEDTVLIPGDLSWALTLAEARFDLDYLQALPGRKLICKGNHDYWWQSLLRVREAAGDSLRFLQHSACDLGPWAVCGTRGWLLPGHADFREEDDRLLRRELLRLEMALQEAAALDKPIVVMLHYPPLYDPAAGSGFCELISAYPQVTDCVYGHVHGDRAPAFEGEYRGVRYHNVSGDRLGFAPLLLAES